MGSDGVSFEAGDLPPKALTRRFQALLCRFIRAAAERGEFSRLPETISIEKLLARVRTRTRRVYVKAPFGGVETLLEYLARYTYRVAITNERIDRYEDHRVTFRWRDYGHASEEKPCVLDGYEFLRRFVMHVPPRGFVRVRSYGFMGNRNRKQNLERARQLIGKAGSGQRAEGFKLIRRLCPSCSGRDERTLHVAPSREVVTQIDIPLRPPPNEPLAA